MHARESQASILSRLTLVLILLAGTAQGSSVLPLTTDQHIDLADAICRGVVVEVNSYRDPLDGGIYTRTLIRVEEALKGKFPSVVELVHRGGVVGNDGEQDGFAPWFRVGEERLLFLSRRADGTLFATQGSPSAVMLQRIPATERGARPFVPAHRQLLQRIRDRIPRPSEVGADVTDRGAELSTSSSSPVGNGTDVGIAAVSGLLVDANGIAARFIALDRGEPIPYLIDAQALPAGITLTQATNAVHNALQAWANVTSLQFKFDGFQNFGQAANTIVTNDAKLRIQLHDLFGAISGATTLGIGGRAFTFNQALFPGGGVGGRVSSNEFHLTTRGFVVLKHTNAAMQTLSTFEEVLCHETGHSLSMAHSSENPAEPDVTLREAIMYFQAHVDGRGAMLGVYDPPIIRQAFPQGNLPPYAFDRMIYCVTSSSALTHPEVNQVEMKGYDLLGGVSTKALTNATANNGAFSLNGNVLTYTASGAFSDAALLDPAGSSFYDRTYVRFDDGTNASPPALVRVIQFLLDTKPTGAPDGAPDSWMVTNFGSATPVAGTSGANDDPDGDGLTNIREFQSATNPRDGNSSLKITSFGFNSLEWMARPFELYEAETSMNVTNWSRFGNPVIPMSSTGSVPGFVTSTVTNQFFRIKKVP